MANKTVTKENVNEKFTMDNVINKVKETAKDVNNVALDTTKDLVNEVIVRGEQWQNVTAKAIEGGMKLMTNQQEIVFDALESVKGQLMHGRKRLKTLFSKN
jgi:hypothetical protein